MRYGPRRVAITGIGLITPLGLGREANWSALLAGRSGVGPITRFDTEGYSARIAGEVRDFDFTRWGSARDARRCDPFIQYAIAASALAIEDGGLPQPFVDPERVGVIIGAGLGGLTTLEETARTLATRGPRRVSPLTIPRLIPNLAAGQVSIHVGAQGPNFGTVSACATGAHCIGDAARMIAWGETDIMLAGGAEATITPIGVSGFAAMKALSTRNDEPQSASRPFDARRDGFVCAEGAGVLILEELELARARGACIYAEIAGFGQSSDAHHITQPAPGGTGAARAMTAALADAGVAPEQVSYINAHATSTPEGDLAETQAIKRALGEHAGHVWVSSTKSMTGHMLGAAGAVEAAYTALALHHQIAPPTINLTEAGEGCDLDYLSEGPREGSFEIALTNSFGFGGTNATIALRRGDVS
ncbi:MAG: beta-ketoacyl-ACP synthase II [Bradymonadia bacterium]